MYKITYASINGRQGRCTMHEAFYNSMANSTIVYAQEMKQSKYSNSPTVVSFQEGIFYLLGGIFVLWLSNDGLVEIGVICIIWIFSLVSRRKKKKKRHLNPESDTSSDDEDDGRDSDGDALLTCGTPSSGF